MGQLRQEHDYIDFDATATLSHPSIDTGTMSVTESIVEQGVNVDDQVEEAGTNFTLPLTLEQYATSRLQGLEMCLQWTLIKTYYVSVNYNLTIQNLI